MSQIDVERSLKVAIQTGLGTAIPCLGSATKNAVVAIGTALIWTEASALVSIADAIITNLFKSSKNN